MKVSKTEIILHLLQEAGADGLDQQVLNRIAFRYGARLFDLRKRGYTIETKQEGQGKFRFFLVGGPLCETSHFSLTSETTQKEEPHVDASL